MDFPISELMDRGMCLDWIERYFHPAGMKCPHCGADMRQARWFRRTKRSDLPVYRCQGCRGIFNVYSGTVFEGRHFTPEKTVLFVQGVLQGKATAQLARELKVSRTTVTEVRHQLQASTEQARPDSPLNDLEVETDEMFQNAGGKRRLARRPARPTASSRQ